MNGSTMVMQWPDGVVQSEDTMTLLGLPSQKAARKQLTGTVDDVVKAVSTLVETAIASVIEKRTKDEFKAGVLEAFPVYARSITALSAILQPLVARQVIDILVNDSFSELEADFREHAVAAFGADIKDQAIFTVWMLRKTFDLSSIIIAAGKVAEINKQKDAEFAGNYAQRALWARFNIDCLLLAMHTKKKIHPEVLALISDGLRCAVDAYAWLRQAVDIYAPQTEPVLPMLEPDEEDTELLAESMSDLAHEKV